MILARLLFRDGKADADGRCVGYDYTTVVIFIPEQFMHKEVVGIEWDIEDSPVLENGSI